MIRSFKQSNKADARPSFSMYPKDILSDPNLAMVSPGACGLWWKMLCTMFISPRRGFLVYSDGHHREVVFTPQSYAVVCGWDPATVTRLWAELVDCGVCSVEEKTGAILSRRMVEDAADKAAEAARKLATSEARRRAGQQGGRKKAAVRSSKSLAKGVANEVGLLADLRKQNPSKTNQELANMVDDVLANRKQKAETNGSCKP